MTDEQPAIVASAAPSSWDAASVAAVSSLAAELGVDALDLLAIWYSESGLDEHRGGGLAQLTPVVESEMRWPAGTIAQVVAGPVAGQLIALRAFYRHLIGQYVPHGSLEATARAWGVSPAVVLYAFAGFPAGALVAAGRDSVLADCCLAYAGNRGIDTNDDGQITVGDVERRLGEMRDRMLADPKGQALGRWVRASSSTAAAINRADPWRALSDAWRRLVGAR